LSFCGGNDLLSTYIKTIIISCELWIPHLKIQSTEFSLKNVGLETTFMVVRGFYCIRV